VKVATSRADRARTTPAGVAETQWSHPLNPEAGAMPMPDDPRLIDAALRAGKISLVVIPYYGFRYGERGVRFTRSDSAFLATLPGHPQATVNRQIEWLAGVLSNRGMPSLLLELHLRVLTKQLIRAAPERAAEHRSLVEAGARLGERRRSVMPEAAARPIVEAFPEAAGVPRSRLSLGTGQLLVAAVADERLGIVNAVKSIETYFLDADLFPASFVSGVRATLWRAKRG
jgi:hypothetical protein